MSEMAPWYPASDCSKLTKNPKNDNDVIIFRHEFNVKLFWRCFVSIVKFSYWSKFHVNIITGSGIMTIFFYKGLTRNSEIGNTHVWVFPNIWRLGWVLQNSRVIAFTTFELLMENQLGGGGGVKLPSQAQIKVKITNCIGFQTCS